MKGLVMAALGAALLGGPALGQMAHGTHGGEEAGAPYAEAWAESMARMHEEMAAPLTGDADEDFARGMIPHHRAAIDMARIQIEHGDDPELRALAEAVIATQEAEIALLEAWLAQREE